MLAFFDDDRTQLDRFQPPPGGRLPLPNAGDRLSGGISHHGYVRRGTEDCSDQFQGRPLRRSRRRGGGILPAGGATAWMGGAGGRRETEKSGRSRVSVRALSGIFHSGLPSFAALRLDPAAGSSPSHRRPERRPPWRRARQRRRPRLSVHHDRRAEPPARWPPGPGREQKTPGPISSLGCPPLPHRPRHRHPHAPALRLAEVLRRLDRKFVNEKIWHSGLDVIEKRLQRRLARPPRRPSELTKPFFASGPSSSTCEDMRAPPAFVTAAPTRCSKPRPRL